MELDDDTVTALVASRLSRRRRDLDMTLAELARGCGISLQQVHRYEIGANVISATMLWQLSRRLRVPVAWFFDELEDHREPAELREQRSSHMGS